MYSKVTTLPSGLLIEIVSVKKFEPSKNKIYVKLTPNPSHLEAVDPLVVGYTRGQIDDEFGGDLRKGLAILIHGDAAVAGGDAVL